MTMLHDAIKNCMERNGEVLCIPMLDECGLCDFTVDATTYGFAHAWVPDAVCVMGEACAYISKTRPDLFDYMPDETNGARYVAWLANVINYCIDDDEVKNAYEGE